MSDKEVVKALCTIVSAMIDGETMEVIHGSPSYEKERQILKGEAE